MLRYWTYVVIVIGLVIMWHYNDIAHVKIKALVMGIGVLTCYILYELVEIHDKIK